MLLQSRRGVRQSRGHSGLMTGPTSPRSTNRRSPLAWFAVALAGFALYGIWVLDPRTLFTLDAAVKLLEAQCLLDSGFTSLSLSYPAATFDPQWQFFPFVSPWVFHAAGGWQGVFPSAVAVLMAPALALGVSGVVAVSALSGAAVVALVSTASPAAPRWSAPLLLGAGSFLWFFSVLPWEHATALALSTWAWLRLVRSTDPAAVAAAGLAIGAATALRDESLLLVPGLLWLLWRDRRGLSSWVTLLVATSAPLALLAIVDVTVFMRPPFAHVAHAVDIAARWLGTPPGVPHRPGWPLSRRYETLVSAWIVGEGGAVYPTVLVVALVSINLWRRTEAARMGVLGIVTLCAVQLAHDLRQFLPHPDFPAGLLRLSPVLIFAFLPSAGDQRASLVRTAGWVTCAGFAAGVLAFLTTDGGPGYGPRLLLPVLPLLCISACEGLWSYRRAVAIPFCRGIWVVGLALFGGSLVMQFGVGMRTFAMFNRTEAAAVQWLESSDERVIVLDSALTVSVVEPVYRSKQVLLADSQRQTETLAGVLARAAVPSFLLVSREPIQQFTFPSYRLDQSLKFGHTTIARWVSSPTGGTLRP